LFKRCAQNAVIHGLQPTPDHFICPICYQKFPIDACSAVDDTSVLTLAHVYPKELGCSVETLACNACNAALNKYDQELILGQTIADKVHSQEPFSVRGSTDDYTFRLFLSATQSALRLEIPPQNNPKVLEAIKSNLGLEFEVDLGANPKYYDLGLLYAAHLLMFREFGYEYLFCWLGHWVRTRTSDCENGKPLFPPVVSLFGADGFRADMIYRVLIVREPREHRCICAVLPAPQEKGVVARAVVLPVSPDSEGINALNAVRTGLRSGGVISIDTEPAHKRLVGPQWKNHLYKSLHFED
jgi:hypothetical protein